MEIFKNKNGEELSLEQLLNMFKGRDRDGDAASVIDFGVYDVQEDKQIGESHFYMVATEAVVEKISFLGPFTMVELDFKDPGMAMLRQVLKVISEFHDYAEPKERIMLSTIASLDPECCYTLSLANPISCVRGFSDETTAATIIQLIYATDNVVFAESEVDIDMISAEIEREQAEILRQAMTDARIQEEQDIIDEIMGGVEDEMFTPDFSVRSTEEKFTKDSDVRISGKQEVDVKVSNHSKGVHISGRREEDIDETDI